MLIGNGNRLRTGKCRLRLVSSFPDPAQNFLLRFDGFRSRELPRRGVAGTLDHLEFACREPCIEIGAHLGIRHIAHAAAKPIPDQRPLIDDCFPFKVLVARERERFTDPVNGLSGLFLVLLPFPCCTDDGLSLMAELGCKLPMRRHHLGGRMNLFSIAR